MADSRSLPIARGAAALLLTVCTSCGGSSSGPATSAPPPQFSVSPSSVSIGVPSAPATLSVSNASTTFTARADNPLIAALRVSGSTVTVVPIASGQATIAVTSGSAVTNVPLTVGLCTPPNPTFTLASPRNGSIGASTSPGTILLAVQNLNGYTPASVASSIVARVSSGSGVDAVTAAPLQAAAAPPDAPSGEQYFSFSVPALTVQTNYNVQAYVSSEPCLPASAIGAGSFST